MFRMSLAQDLKCSALVCNNDPSCCAIYSENSGKCIRGSKREDGTCVIMEGVTDKPWFIALMVFSIFAIALTIVYITYKIYDVWRGRRGICIDLEKFK